MAGLYDQFQSILGRAPSQDEASYFQKYIDAGDLQPHEVGHVLQSLPEYQQAQLTKNAGIYGQQLNAQNGAILDQAAAAANSRFAGLGRPVTSAMAASVGQAGGQLAQARQSALAAFYGKGLQDNTANQFAMGQNAMNHGYAVQDQRRQHDYAISDYYRQKNDFADYERAHSGWNAITPEFVGNGLFSIAGKALAAKTGRTQ